jgi:KDO2-lipid IV(A) lauroyltransferase
MTMKKGIKWLKRWLIYVSVCGLIKLMCLLPRRAAIAVMRGVGLGAFCLLKSKRERMVQHLGMAFGNEKSSDEIKKIARQVFLNIGTCAADAIRIPQLIEDRMENLITIEGREHIDRVFSSGQSAIFLTAHFGNWELLGAWFAKNGYPVKVVGAQNHDPRLDKLIVGTRNQAGYTNITRKSNTRDILRAIRDGYLIGMLIDQDTKVEGVFVKFFNQWAHTAIGPVVLAKKYDLKIIPVFMRLNSDLTYHMEVQEPLKLEFTDDIKHDLVVNTQKCSDTYERIIRRFPEQWVWMHRRWKKQPQAIN